MADHLHKQIRDALKTKLTGLTTSGSHVYANRLQVMADTNLPGLRIFGDDENCDTLTMHTPALQERTIDVLVECCSKKVTGLDDELDLMSKEVEIALSSGITVGTRNVPCIYRGMKFDDELADKPIGIKRLRFSIDYTAMNNAPDVLS